MGLIGYFTISLSFLLPIQEVSARCPNGYHKSPSGDCEEVTDTKGMPRCENGYHRSPDGDCERVSESTSAADTDNVKSSRETDDKDDDSNNNDKYFDFTNTKNNNGKNSDDKSMASTFSLTAAMRCGASLALVIPWSVHLMRLTYVGM